jgi:hypothetical protein
MRMFGYPFYFVYLYFIVGCATPKATTSSSPSTSNSAYSEDLSALRPKIEKTDDTVIALPTDQPRTTVYVEPKFAVNDKLDTVLDSIDRANLSRKFVEGYTIQVYSGRREEALNTKKQLTSLLPEITSDVQFTEPIFRVKAGKYYNWLDAQGDFTLIKKYFPAAIIIPDKIAIN